MPKELDTPPCPSELGYLVQWYNEVFTGERLSYTELQAWSALTGKRVMAWEIEVLKRLDNLYLRVQHDGRSKPSSTGRQHSRKARAH